jgi:hypothetical protein
MYFLSYSIAFWFIVVHAWSRRCFTLTVRPRSAFALPVPRARSFLLFRRLRAMVVRYLKWKHSLHESTEAWRQEVGAFPVLESGASSLALP